MYATPGHQYGEGGSGNWGGGLKVGGPDSRGHNRCLCGGGLGNWESEMPWKSSLELSSLTLAPQY